LAGKVAVVTGASSGIGWALAKRLAAEGCKLGLIARREAPLAELASQIRSAGGVAAFATADVSERVQVEHALAALREQLGPIDLAFANAGVGMPTLLDPVNVADVEAMIRVNVLGVVYLFAAVLPEMLKRKTGHLVGVSSLAGYRALPGESGYCASKAAVNAYLDGLRMHLRGTGVSVTTACPGFVKTPMTEMNTFHMPQLLEADEAARRIVRAVRRGRKVYDFPWRLSLMTKLSRWLPDRVMIWVMGDYNADAAAHAQKPKG
ncbi:MAG TPA: SDR family NAD(P)-dependent oxidoreductase, partial [Gemmataceae bacterium]|nr:SDR family NAD(P)-dependent oxidoreductase [Gemmataceae bacterium]